MWSSSSSSSVLLPMCFDNKFRVTHWLWAMGISCVCVPTLSTHGLYLSMCVTHREVANLLTYFLCPSIRHSTTVDSGNYYNISTYGRPIGAINIKCTLSHVNHRRRWIHYLSIYWPKRRRIAIGHWTVDTVSEKRYEHEWINTMKWWRRLLHARAFTHSFQS